MRYRYQQYLAGEVESSVHWFRQWNRQWTRHRIPVTLTQTRNDVDDRSAHDRLVPDGIHAPSHAPRDTQDLPLARRDAHDPHPALEVVYVPSCARNDTSVPHLVRERVRDRPAAKDVSLEAHTAADMRCISSLFKILTKATEFHFSFPIKRPDSLVRDFTPNFICYTADVCIYLLTLSFHY